MQIDGWLRVAVSKDVIPGLTVLRSRLAVSFAARVAKPKAPLSDQHLDTVRTLSACFLAEGISCGLDAIPITNIPFDKFSRDDRSDPLMHNPLAVSPNNPVK